MTQSDKQLLLKDLCARLPYGVMVSVQGGEFDSHKYPYQLTAVSKFGLESFCRVYHPIYTPFGVPKVEEVKPYLRPMSSMTKEEIKEFHHMASMERDYLGDDNFYTHYQMIDWLYAHHFDFRGLLEKSLAIVAPEGMY